MDALIERAAGLDVHQGLVVACVGMEGTGVYWQPVHASLESDVIVGHASPTWSGTGWCASFVRRRRSGSCASWCATTKPCSAP